MRTIGDFKTIYDQARAYYNGVDIEDMPHNPVVRRENNRWVIESGNNYSDSPVSILLDDVHSYFYNAYSDSEYTPSSDDEQNFIEYFKSN